MLNERMIFTRLVLKPNGRAIWVDELSAFIPLMLSYFTIASLYRPRHIAFSIPRGHRHYGRKESGRESNS